MSEIRRAPSGIENRESKIENVIAGPTLDRYPDASAFALKNLRAFAAGQPLEAVITPEIYDRTT